MTEEIINALSKIEGLKVTARTSSFVYKAKKMDVRHIGNELGVSTVLEGSVRKSQNTVRITAQLIRTDNGFHIWSENFDRELENVFQLQDEISLLIADKIRENFGHISIDEHLVTPQTSNLRSYELFLKGRFFFFTWNLFDIEKAIAFFKDSIAADPAYDQPYFGAAWCYSLLGSWGHMDKEEAFRHAESYLAQGSKLGKDSVDRFFAHAVHEFWGSWDYKRAYKSLQNALSVNPQHPETLDFMAELNRSTGDFATAISLNEKAMEYNPMSTNAHYTRATLLYFQSRFEESLGFIRKGLSIDPSFELLHQLQVVCLIHLDSQEDLDVYLRSAQISPLLSRIGKALYQLLHGEQVRETHRLLEEIDQLDSPPLYPWDIYLTLHSGDTQGAMQRLQTLVEAHMGQVVNFKNDPFLSTLRDHPTFQALVRSSFPETEIDIRQPVPHKTRESSLTPNEVSQYIEALKSRMDEESVYLDTALTLRDLAEKISLHPNKLSWLLNEKVGKNFNDYVNGYRLKAFQQKAVDPANEHLTLLGLAYESGFTSKTVFNDFFKKSTGLTPKAWLKDTRNP